jgi:hypothetical protein
LVKEGTLAQPRQQSACGLLHHTSLATLQIILFATSTIKTVLDDESDDPIPDSDNKPEERTEREVGPEEQKLREEYLDIAEQDRERYMELTTLPPDILDHGDIVHIKRHRTSNRAGKKSHSFCVEMSMGKDLNR